MDRRNFIRWLLLHSAALMGGSAITACQKRLRAVPGVPEKFLPSTSTSEFAAAPTSTPAPSIAQSPTPQPNFPDIAVSRGPDPERLVRAAVDALGGISRFVSSGADVIIKPNICVAYHTYEYAATTNPWVVGALVKLAWEAGARRVRVLDFPFGGTCQQAYRISGIEEAVLEAGGEMEAISHFKFQSVEIPNPMDLARCEIYDEVLKADVLINVPIAKHHSLARLTLGMKNLMGVIQDRPAMHRNIGDRLADLAKTVRPGLTVIDAIRILRAHGPTGGSLSDVQETDTVIASPDIVAADSYAATLFGLAPSDLAYVVSGTLNGLGRMDLERMRIEEIYADA